MGFIEAALSGREGSVETCIRNRSSRTAQRILHDHVAVGAQRPMTEFGSSVRQEIGCRLGATRSPNYTCNQQGIRGTPGRLQAIADNVAARCRRFVAQRCYPAMQHRQMTDSCGCVGGVRVITLSQETVIYSCMGST
jgi:hypothetical protein